MTATSPCFGIPGRSCRRRKSLAVLVALAITVARTDAMHGQEGGIEVFAAETLFGQGWRLSASHLYKRKGNVFRGDRHQNDPLDRLFEEQRFVAGVDYGVLPALTLSLLVPTVYKSQRQRVSGGGRERLESFGLGDVALLGKYRVFKRDWERGAFHLAVISGLEFPSGDTDADEDGVRLPPALQPGLGAWNPVTALAANLELDLFRFDGLFFYKINTEGAQDFEAGDFIVVEFDAHYRFLHTQYPGPTASAKLGVQWRHEMRDELDGHRVRNSGADVIALRPGVSWHPLPQIDISVTLDVPIYRYVRGEQLVLDVRTFFAVGLRF